MRILVADDDPLQRAKMSVLLRNSGYDVVEASDGAEAWSTMQREPIRLVFTDWMMPQLSGLDLIGRIRNSDLGHYVYVILCSGKDSKADVVAGIQAGADDFLGKPAHPDELRARIHAGQRVIKLQENLEQEKKELQAAYALLSNAHARISQDLASAAKLQESLLPRPGILGGIRYDWVFRPTSQVAGDIFNVLPLDPDHIGFYQLDVSGHGVPAAMLSFSLCKLLQPTPVRDSLVKRMIPDAPFYQIVPPDQVVCELNRSFQNDNDIYFTMVYGVINTKAETLQFTQAGHPHPILLRPGEEPRCLGDGGLPVAVIPSPLFELSGEQLELGDRLVLCSDGATECAKEGGGQFGIARAIDHLRRAADQPLPIMMSCLEKALLDWNGSDEFADDVSILGLELCAGVEGSPARKRT